MPDPQPAAATVPILSPDGTPGVIPAAQLDDALAQGYSQPPNPLETTGQQVGALAEGVGQGLIPGFPKLEKALAPGVAATSKARQETFPGTTTAGKVIGGGLQMAGVAAATGGLGELAEGAEAIPAAAEAIPGAEAAADVAKGVDTAAAAEGAGATPGAASGAVDAATTAGPTTAEEAASAADIAPSSQSPNLLQSGYTQQALAGGVNSGSNYINESELGDHQFNAEAMAQQVGLGGLLGLAGEGGINLLRDTVAPPVITKAGVALDALKKTASKAFFSASDLVNSLEPGTTEAAGKAILGGAEKLSSEGAEKLATDMNSVGESMKDIGISHGGEDGYRAQAAGKALADVPRATVAAGLTPINDGIEQAMGQAKTLFDDETFQGKGAYNGIKRAQAKFASAISDPATSAADLHAATLEFKQAVGESGLFTAAARTPEQIAAQQFLTENVWRPLQTTLRDESVFGSEQAGRNAAFDAAARSKINAAKQVAKDFGAHELDLDSGKNELYLKPSRIRGAFTGDPLANAEKLQHLNEYIDAAKNYIKEVQVDAGAAGAVAPGGKDLEALLESVTNQRNAARAYEPVTALLKATREQAPWGLGAGGAAPLAGVGAHLLGAGAPVIAPVVGAVAALRSPVKALEMYASIAGAAETAKNVIGGGIKRILANNPARVAITGAAINSLRGRTIRDADGNGSNTFARQAKNIGALMANQEGQVQALTQNTSRLHDIAPNTTMALHQVGIKGLQELFNALPKNPAPSPLPSENKDWKPPPDQLSAWNSMHEAILKPSTFLDACADGTASPAVWGALQRVYPQWTASVQSATMKHLASHPDLALTTAQKLCTSMILGSPISPTVAPDQVAFQQSLYSAQAQAPAGGLHRRPTQHGMDKLDLGTRSELGTRSKR